jgi:hypothetical protein
VRARSALRLADDLHFEDYCSPCCDIYAPTFRKNLLLLNNLPGCLESRCFKHLAFLFYHTVNDGMFAETRYTVTWLEELMWTNEMNEERGW